MIDRNQAYSKVCGECRRICLKLFITPTKIHYGKKTYRMLCEECAGNLVVKE